MRQFSVSMSAGGHRRASPWAGALTGRGAAAASALKRRPWRAQARSRSSGPRGNSSGSGRSRPPPCRGSARDSWPTLPVGARRMPSEAGRSSTSSGGASRCPRRCGAARRRSVCRAAGCGKVGRTAISDRGRHKTRASAAAVTGDLPGGQHAHEHRRGARAEHGRERAIGQRLRRGAARARTAERCASTSRRMRLGVSAAGSVGAGVDDAAHGRTA